MALVKICPTCKTKNNPGAMFCENDLVDLSAISPLDDSQPEIVNKVVTTQLTLKTSNGCFVALHDGDVVGREGVGSDLLCDYVKVSRQHARVTQENEKWYIEDLNSTNGVYLNGNRIPSNKIIELSDGLKLNLSQSCELVVKIQTDSDERAGQ